jgi:branched-chain amino acid transport system ATP-binding protein
VGRTFQQVQLVGDLTVRENLLVATHIHNPTGLISHLVVTTASARAEAEAEARVREAAELVGIAEHLDSPAGSLPYGTLRMVELARAIATGAPLVMLDEPAAGLDDNETQALGALLRRLRDDLGLGLLLIEHDIGLVTEICDLVWVLDRGEIIATGTPAEVRNDPAVVAAYLGEPN